jgi:hypothetical protein
LTVPITNSLAFLFTVFGDWWVERKVIGRGKLSAPVRKPESDANYSIDTWIGMALSLSGIALCVQSKNN